MVLSLALLAAPTCAVGAGPSIPGRTATGTISGIISDAQGVPQMGALVEAVLPDASLLATAVTDRRGHFRFANLRPGTYRIQATAALFLPSVHQLAVQGGKHATLNMTLSTLLAPANWLPVRPRTTADPSDDWTWTLRASANRPLLRMVQPSGVQVSDTGDLEISSSISDRHQKTATGGVLTVSTHQGAFAQGGTHNLVLLERADTDGSGSIFRADLSDPRTPFPVGPSAEVTAGFERQLMLGSYVRTTVTYSSHPELQMQGGQGGVQGAVIRSAQRISLGDSVRIDGGSVLRDLNAGGNAARVEPFFRLSVKPSDSLVLAYSYSQSAGTESMEDLDHISPVLPEGVMLAGHLRLQSGYRQAISITGKIPGGGPTVDAAYYRESMHNPLVSGIGLLGPRDLASPGFIADPTTETFLLAARDFGSSGLRVIALQPVGKHFHVGGGVITGSALDPGTVGKGSLRHIEKSLAPVQTYAALVSADGRILRTGTVLRASYRWQPQGTVSPVDQFQANDDGAYLGCQFRQSLHWTHIAPNGLQAVVELQNLLAQGYQPYISTDGEMLFLAQTPRAMQAGVAFTF